MDSPPINARRGQTPRQMIARFARALINGRGEIDRENLKLETLNHFLVDEVFMERLVNEYIEDVFATVLRAEIANTRNNFVLEGDEVVTRNTLSRRRTLRYLFNWAEYVNGKTIKLPDMTRADLQWAAKYRKRAALTDIENAVWMEELADRLREGQKVREVFPDEEALAGFVNSVRTRVRIERQVVGESQEGADPSHTTSAKEQ